MSLKVVDGSGAQVITLAAIPLRTPGQLMELDLLLERPSCAVPVRASLEGDAVELGLGDGLLRVKAGRLTLHGAVAVGAGKAAMPDAEAGESFLARLAEELGQQAPARREGQAPVFECDVQLSAHRPAESELAVKLSFPFGNLWALIVGEGQGSLIVGEDELSAWEGFAAGFVEIFRDGRPLRLKAATEAELECDAPLLTELRALEGTEGVRMHDVELGAEWIVAPRKLADGTALVCWRPPSFAPTELCRLAAPRCLLYPAPRGSWVVVETTVPGADGSLTDGQARRMLLDVNRTAEDPKQLLELCDKSPLFSFGDTSQAVRWSADGLRFAMMGRQVELDGAETGVVVVYDVDKQEPTDEIAGYHARQWDGERLILSRLEEGGWTLHEWTPGGSDEPRPRSEDAGWRVGPYRLRDEEAGLGVKAPAGAWRLFADPAQGFRMAFAGRYAIEPGADPRVLDLQSLTWRYLAREGGPAGPWAAAAAGKVVLYADFRFGYEPALPVAPAEPADWRAAASAGRATALGRLGRFAEAAAIAADLPGPAAVIEGFRRRLEAHEQYAEGERLAESERFDEAARCFVGAAEREPEWDQAHRMAVTAFSRADDGAQMAAAAERWCASRPGSPGAHLQLSIARQRCRDLPGALQAVRDALELAPESAALHYQHGCALALSGDHDGALAAINRAVALDESFAREIAGDEDLAPLRGMSGFSRFDALRLLDEANQLYREGRLRDAMPKLIEAVDLDAENEAAFRGLALCSSELGDGAAFGEATAAWVEAHPNSLRAWLFRFDAHMQQRDGAAALDAAARLERLDPSGPAAPLCSARAKAISGDERGALESLRLLLERRSDLASALEQYPELASLRRQLTP